MAENQLVIGTTKWQSPTAPADVVRARRTPIKRRLILTAIALAIALVAVAGWAVQALRAAMKPSASASTRRGSNRRDSNRHQPIPD
jgi:uncharacterized protein HemX